MRKRQLCRLIFFTRGVIGQCLITCTLLPFPIFFEKFFKIFIDLRYIIPCNVSQPTPYLFILTARLASI